MKFIVSALSVNPRTGDVTGGPRDEIVDTEENILFAGCHTPWEVEDQYEAYWNRLNASWEDNFPDYKAKVKVLDVKPA